MAKNDETDGLSQIKRDLTDSEIRLNALDLAVRSYRLYGSSRPGTTPLDLAAVYYGYIKGGKLPEPKQVKFAEAKPMPMDGDFGHGAPPVDEGDDITPRPPGAASIRQAGNGG